MAARYVYDKVASSDNICRVLTLHPGNFEDDVTISLSTVQLIRNQKQTYGALSYTWGSNERSDKIYVVSQGERGDDSYYPYIPTTVNLVQALRHLRTKDTAMLLWADGVCINQDDVQERGEQVRIMPQIYRSAAHVWIWLGVQSDDSSYALEILRHWGSKVSFDRATLKFTMKDPNDPDQWMLKRRPDSDFQKRSEGPLEALTSRPWFERTWVQQEVVLSGGEATMVCGNASIPWPDFFAAFRIISGRYLLTSSERMRSWQSRWYLIDRLGMPSKQPFEELLYSVRPTKCFDPRDKVFGVLGMLQDDEAWIAEALIPDYTLEVAELYKRVSQILLRDQHKWRVLAQCELDGTSPVRPTWAIDWRSPRTALFQTAPRVTSTKSSTIECQVNGDTLLVRGAVCDTVNEAQRLEAHDVSILDTVERAVRTTNGFFNSEDFLFDAKLTAILYALSQGNLTRHEFAYTQLRFTYDLDELKEAYRCMLRYIDGKDELAGMKDDEHVEHWLMAGDRRSRLERAIDLPWSQLPLAYQESLIHLMTVNLNSRSLIKTAHGRFGLAPFHTQNGDVLAVLLGLDNTIALRPQSDGSYEIVGVCSVHGLNWGEGILGALDPWVWSFEKHPDNDESGMYWLPRFRHLHTGELHSRDPRIDYTPSATRDAVMRRIASELEKPEGELSPLEYEYFRRHGKPLQTIAIK